MNKAFSFVCLSICFLAYFNSVNCENCRGYYTIYGAYVSGEVCLLPFSPYCCGSCYSRYCCNVQSFELNQDDCTNYQWIYDSLAWYIWVIIGVGIFIFIVIVLAITIPLCIYCSRRRAAKVNTVQPVLMIPSSQTTPYYPYNPTNNAGQQSNVYSMSYSTGNTNYPQTSTQNQVLMMQKRAQ